MIFQYIRIKGWDGHALWLNIDDKESKGHILSTDTFAARSMTFDLDESIANNIRSKAEIQGVSLNTYVNQIIKRFLEWDSFEPKAGIIPISKPILTELFINRTEEEVIDIARRVGKKAVPKHSCIYGRRKGAGLELIFVMA